MSDIKTIEIDTQRIKTDLKSLMMLAGPSGYEGRVRRYITRAMRELALPARTDNPGNLIVSLLGNENAPSVMIHTHMDQLGFVVRKIEANGYVRVERLGGIPERALAAQELLFCVGEGRDVPGIVANKSHHATRPDEKYRVLPVEELYVDTGFSDRESVLASGVDIGTPAV